MKKIIYFAVLLLAVASCGSENDYLNAEFDSAARCGKDTVTCYVYSTRRYSVHTDSTWCYLYARTSSMDASFDCYVDSNPTKQMRCAPIVIDNGVNRITINLYQYGNSTTTEVSTDTNAGN